MTQRKPKPQRSRELPADVELPLHELNAAASEAARATNPPGPAAKLLEAARLLQEAAAELAQDVLPAGSQSGNHIKMLEPAHLHRSEGALNTSARVERFLDIARPAGHTLRSIAKEVGMKHPHLGNALRGTKRIRASWAMKIQALTRSQVYPNGFEATEANWPGGWARED